VILINKKLAQVLTKQENECILIHASGDSAHPHKDAHPMQCITLSLNHSNDKTHREGEVSMYIDYYVVHNVFNHYLRNDSDLENQVTFFDKLFASCTRKLPKHIDPGDISRIKNGQMRMSPKIREYYAKDGSEIDLAMDIEENIFPQLYSYQALTHRFWCLLTFDFEMRDYFQENGLPQMPGQFRREAAMFLGHVVRFAILREFIERNPENGKLCKPEWLVPNVGKYILSAKVPAPCGHFMGRGDEIKRLHEELVKKRTVFLTGLPGIGTSEVVYAYCKEHGKDYNKIVYIDYSGNLQEDIRSLVIVGGMITSDDGYKNVIQFLRKLEEDVLLVIDNMDASFEQEPYLDNVLTSGCKVLIASQCQFEDEKCMKLEEIQDMQILSDIVKKVSDKQELDPELLEKVITAVHRHTTAVVLLGALIKKGDYPLKAILLKLKMWDLRSFFTEKLRFRKGYKRVTGTYYEQIRLLFGLFRFSEEEQDVLRNMVLMPRAGIPKSLLREWMELENADAINSMVEAGMLNEAKDGVVRIKPIIRELAKEEFSPSFANCAKMLKYTANAMTLLQDSPSDKYLLLLPEEVITWADKEGNMEAYIDYLHKSFELAARYEHKSTMPKIADALAEAIVGTPYGTNLDRALMQDYQAVVTDDPRRGIEFRKSALEQLNMANPLEKKTAADILSNLSDNYETLQQFDHAKACSDESWKIYEELNLLNTKEVFAAACRRGVLLCEVGQAAEGFDILKKTERYVETHGQVETKNHAEIYGALALAYYAVGDLTQRVSYEAKARRVLERLNKRVATGII